MSPPPGPLQPFPAEAERQPAHSYERRDSDAELEEVEDDHADCFFETFDRIPSRVSFCVDLPTSSSDADDDDEEEDDGRISFASAIAPPSEFHSFSFARGSPRLSFDEDERDHYGSGYDYDVWLEPISIQERRRRLFQGMGLGSNKDLVADHRTLSSHKGMSPPANGALAADAQPAAEWLPLQASSSMKPSSPLQRPLFARSRSDDQLDRRRGSPSPRSPLFRSSSAPSSFWSHHAPQRPAEDDNGERREAEEGASMQAGMCLIKDLDNGKEFMISEVGKDGSSNQLNDLQTGDRFTMEEFEQFLGHSPIVKEVMRRANLTGGKGQNINDKTSKSLLSKSLRSRSRKKIGWLKNIKFVTSPVNWLIPEKERVDDSLKGNGKSSSDSTSDLMKVRNHGKSYKELTGLCMSQDIHAHQGSIWTLKFSSDAQYLASAGEDCVVHVWKVQECNAFSTPLLRQELRVQSSRQAVANGSPERSPLLGTPPTPPLKKTKKGKSSKKSLPGIILPEVIFSLSEKPECTFEGHLADVLDLSWSRSQYLLSSSMDKTVRLWDMETKACLKLFEHNDYVTCIQFNPIDDRYFISGSLDAKIRMWSIPDRQVVDWSDLHEMVTAVCYTPDGQGALVGSHRGICRLYKTSEYKLSQESQVAIRRKKNKSHSKKITGFQFSPVNQSEMLVTSADSQVRVFDGVNLIHKFKGFRNTSSQICASYTSDGKYVLCASEDSHVYIWKRDQTRNTVLSKGKGWSTTSSYEHFYCKDVTVAIPWTNAGSNHAPSRRYGHQDGLASSDSQRSNANLDDIFHSSRSYRSTQPPLPKKSLSECVHANEDRHSVSRTRSSAGNERVQANEDLRSVTRTRSSAGNESFTSGSASQRSIFHSGPLSSATTSWRWYTGSSRKHASTEVNAWGLAVVTADLSGHIRIYQNFGLPVRISR